MDTKSMNRKNGTIRNLCKQNQLYILAFAMPFFIMLFLFVINGIYPFGDQSFLYSDMQHQYYPFLLEFYEKLKNGESLAYSWNTGLGTNFVSLYAYYLSSPFNWLCIFFPENRLIEFLSYLVIIKIALCGLTASIYMSRHFHTKRRYIALFSLFYAMSGFVAAYNWNIMWLDCLILTPLIILGLEQLVSNQKYKLYCLTLSLSIICNYYLSIMICIYLVLYFFIVLFPAAKQKKASFIRFAFFSLLSGGIASVLLLPVAKSLPLAARATSSFPTELQVYSSPLEVIAGHFMNVTPTTLDYLPHFLPNIYCSVAVFILLPLYILNTQIAFKDKIRKILLLVIILLSFSINITNYIWHGFTFPRSLPARHSFLYILLLITLCLDTFIHIQGITRKNLIITFSGIAIYMFFVNFFIEHKDITYECYASTIGFIIIYGVFLCLYLSKKLTTYSAVYLIAIIVIAEATANTLATSISTTLYTHNIRNHDSVKRITAEQTASDNGKIYRYDKMLRFTDNDALLEDYPSLSVFSSTGSKLANHFYHKYGMQGLDVHITSKGATPFTYGLLSGGYTLGNTLTLDSSFYELLTVEDSVCLYRNLYSVPLGFFITPDESEESYLISDYKTSLHSIEETDELTPLERQNLLANNLGATEILFEPLVCEIKENYSTIEVDSDTYVYAHFTTPRVTEISILDNEKETTLSQDPYYKYVESLGYRTAGSTLQLSIENVESDNSSVSEDADTQLRFSAYGLNINSLKEVMNTLNQNTMTITSMTSNQLSGTITTNHDGYLILSIPYDPGFNIKVDNKEVSAYLFDDMMIAIPLTEGNHIIDLQFYPDGLITGIVISLLSILIFVSICVKEKITHKTHTPLETT